jgi:hypothetical protein
MHVKVLFVVAVLAAAPGVAFAQADQKHHPGSPDTALVDFGVLPLQPIGPPPCLQSGGIGGPADPCSYKLHHLTPEETDVDKGGEVTFQFHGGGHAFAIYEVDKKVTRDDVGQALCPGDDPSTIESPGAHLCNLSALNANAAHVIDIGHETLAVPANVTNTHPDNRVWVVDGRLMSAGGRQFLNGGTIPAGASSDGQLVTFRFEKNGRYLIICMNRVHFLNDWMFGFVNVK